MIIILAAYIVCFCLTGAEQRRHLAAMAAERRRMAALQAAEAVPAEEVMPPASGSHGSTGTEPPHPSMFDMAVSEITTEDVAAADHSADDSSEEAPAQVLQPIICW